MHDAAAHFTTVFMAFFAIMNPVANAPLFVGLTDGLDARTRRAVAFRSVLLAFVLVGLFAVLGRQIFAMFGITLGAFRIAGGVLVALVGYHLLQGQESSVHTPTSEDNENSQEAALGIAISPLAMPILAGPGTLATAMNYAAESTAAEISRVLMALGAVCLLTLVAFLASERMVSFLGQNAIKVVSRLMGLILSVIGVQMLIEGIHDAVKAGGGS